MDCITFICGKCYPCLILDRPPQGGAIRSDRGFHPGGLAEQCEINGGDVLSAVSDSGQVLGGRVRVTDDGGGDILLEASEGGGSDA